MAENNVESPGFQLEQPVQEAIERLQEGLDWESEARKRFLDDYKFAEADPDNGYQWPNDLRANRDVDDRPCLTINKTRQHNLQIINDAKQNKPGIKIVAVGNDATVQSAQCWEALCRHIEYISNAQAAYDQATSFQVKAGIGWLRVVTDYRDAETFDQEIYIKGVKDPLTVVIDPFAQEVDKSDANWGIIFEDHAKKAFKAKHPQWAKYCDTPALGQHLGWVKDEVVRTAEYYRRVWTEDTLLGITTDGDTVVQLASKLPEELVKDALNDPAVQKRKVRVPKVEYFFIVGYTIVEKKDWLGKYVPLVPVIGEETVIEGVMDRKGHTRAMKDPQRIYNYWASSAVEFVALQGKTPWVGPAVAFEGYETYWDTANRENHSFLPYNHLDDDGNELSPPQRAAPPQFAPAYLQGMQISNQDMMFVSGQYESQFGAPGNERTGKAINERQRQGDNATYHFIDNLAIAIRYLGKILIDLIPKIYDTKRIIQVMAEDGTTAEIMIDPQAQQAFAMTQMENAEAAQRVLNPKKGRYEVQADVGPGYATKRQEAFQAIGLLLTQAPQLTTLIGDILLKAGDFPMADEAAARLRRMVPPEALGLGPSAQEKALQGQVQQLTQLLDMMMDEQAKAKLKEMQATGKLEVEEFRAETERLKVLGDKNFGLSGTIPQDQIQALVMQAVEESLNTRFGPDVAPIEGAEKGPDGKWYIQHPTAGPIQIERAVPKKPKGAV